MSLAPGIHILLCWGNEARIIIPHCKNLQWIQSLSAGVEDLIPILQTHPQLQGTSMKTIHGIPLSEHILGMLLAYTRGLYRSHDNQKKKIWKWNRSTDLYGLEAAILGFGDIGQAVALRLKTFGIHVTGIDSSDSKEHILEKLIKADIVISLLPETEQTRHMIGSDFFSAMKQDTLFMNFGRGSAVQEKALLKALERGKIKAAFLDVFETEPLPDSSPLWDMDQVYITPHTGGSTEHYLKRAGVFFLENLKLYLNKKPLSGLVNTNKGY